MRSPHPSLARPGGAELYCHHDAVCATPAGTTPAVRQQSHRHPAGVHEQEITRPGCQGSGGDAVRLGHTGDGGARPGGWRCWYDRRHRSALSQEPRPGHPLQAALGLSVRNASTRSLLLRSRHSCYAPSPAAERRPAPWAQQQVLLPRACASGSPPRRVRTGSAHTRRSCPPCSG